jgi:quinol monooxygenase YgiN
MKKILVLLTLCGAVLANSCKQNSAPAEAVPASDASAIENQKMITARVFIKEGHEEEFATAAKWIIENTLKEEGCLEYTLYQDPYNKSNFFFFERYKDQAAVDAHFAASYFTEFGTKIGDMTSKPAEIQVWDIQPNQ